MRKLRILNLTQHNATPDQLEEGVIEPSKEIKEKIKEILTFNNIPSKEEINNRAKQLADIAENEEVHHAMIGGAPFFMSALEYHLTLNAIVPLYAFSIRESVEETLEDGTVVKKNLFKHKGFVAV